MPSANTPLKRKESQGDRKPELPGIHTRFPPPSTDHARSGNTIDQRLRTASTQQLPGSRSTTARLPSHDLPTVRPHKSEQGTSQPYFTTNQKSLPPFTDRHHAQYGCRSWQPQAASDSDSSFTDSDHSSTGTWSYEVSYDSERVSYYGLRKREQPIIPKVLTSTTSSKVPAGTSQPASYAQATRSLKDPQGFRPGVAKDIPSKTSVASHPPSGRPQNARVVRGYFSSDEQQGTSEIRQKGFNHGQGIMGTIMSFIPSAGPPPKDENQLMRDQLDNYKRELRRTRDDMRKASYHINELHNEKERWKDQINGLQNELKNVHRQLKDTKTLAEVRRKELFDSQVFLTKADTLSVSEVGEKVTALNDEIFQAAATFGKALIHQRYEVLQEELDDAVTECQEMVGEKITSLLISQARKPEPEVNFSLVQLVLQILMVKFCVSKIQSWYPSDAAIAGFLDAIYSDIHSTEGQSVPGQWRILSRAHARPTTGTWTKELCRKIMSVLKIAAWMPDSPENQVESFKQRFPPIFKVVSEIRNAIRDKFASADLDISIFDCDSIYDPSFMEDMYGDNRRFIGNQRPEVVVGTIGIGLKKLMVERGADGDLQFQNVISAKIISESTLKEGLELVQSSDTLRRKNVLPVGNTDGADQDGHVDCQDGRD